MPIYRYRCLRCGFKFERQIFIQVSKVICPKCKGEAKRIFFPSP